MNTIRVQMDQHGNFVEESLEAAIGAKVDNAEGSSITWRDTAQLRESVTINMGAHPDHQLRQQQHEAQYYFDNEVKPLYRPRERHETDVQYARRMHAAQRKHGIYEMMVENGLNQLEMSQQIEASRSEPVDGFTPQGIAELERELAKQDAAGVGKADDPF